MGNTALYTRLAECLIKHTDYFFGEPETPSPIPQRHIPVHSFSDQMLPEVEEKEEDEQVKGERRTSSTLERSEPNVSSPTNGDSVGGECCF